MMTTYLTAFEVVHGGATVGRGCVGHDWIVAQVGEFPLSVAGMKKSATGVGDEEEEEGWLAGCAGVVWCRQVR